MHFLEDITGRSLFVLCRYLVSSCFFVSLLLAVTEIHAADFTFSGSLQDAREGHTATLLQNGKVLIVGGTGELGVTLSSAVIYDPATGTFSSAGVLNVARGNHTATLLPNGKVLIVGGYDGSVVLGSAELYDPVTNSFVLTGSLTTARYLHSASLLANGKVLIAGGEGTTGIWLNSAELFDPATGANGTFSIVTSTMSTSHVSPTATVLPNGNVLLVGGMSPTADLYNPVTNSFSIPVTLRNWHYHNTATLLANGKVLIAGGYNDNDFIVSIELYDSVTGVSSSIPAFIQAVRDFHTATLLPNGKVLIVGGAGQGGYLTSAELFDPVANTFAFTTSGLNTARKGHTATLLPNGQVLVAGGYNGDYLASAELYTPPAGSFTAVGPLTAARQQHTATPLPNGKILLAGGYNGGPLTSSELYDPTTGARDATGNLTTARYNHSATLLSNGKVLLIGGEDGTATPLASAELFDPTAGAFGSYSPIATGSLAAGRFGHSASLLPNGKVLVTGGTGSAGVLASAELFDLASGTFAAANGAMQSPRTSHSATLLATGSVLLAGGANGSPLASAELFDPVTGTFTATAGSLNGARSLHSATLLPSGKVLLAGGENGATLGSAELFSPATGTFADITAGMTSPRKAHTATLLANGSVLLAGGSTGAGYAGAELYDPAVGNLGSFVATAGSLGTPRSGHTATLVTNGKVLITGGTNGPTLNSTELFDLGSFTGDARRPTVSTITPTVGQPRKLTLAGTGFQSDSEGSGGGTNSSATNYPLFRLQRVDNGLATFVTPDPATSWSATNFQTTSLYGLQAGYYQAALVANAIPSHARLLRIAPLSAAAPLALDFPNAALNVTTAPQDVTITNNGTADLQFGAKLFSPNDGKFSITAGDTCLGVLLPGDSCLVPVTFQTATPGNVAATLAIQSNDPDAPVTTIALTGSVEALPAIAVAPATLDFPDVSPGSPSVAQQVQISNTGNASLVLGAKTFTPNDGKFTIAAAPVDTCVGTLAPAASCTFSVVFQSAIPESVVASLAISSNDPLNPVSTVALMGTTVAPLIAVTPLALDFPNATPNVLTAPQTVQIRNDGNAPLVPGAKTFTPNDGRFSISEDTCVAALAPAGACTFKVSFLTAGAGNFAATLSLASNDALTPVPQVALTGSALAPVITVTPAALDFPNVPINLPSAPQQVQIKNDGTADLLPGTKTISPNDGRFTISADTCGGSLIPGASCTFNVVFQSPTPGPVAATLSIPSNDLTSPLKTVALTATALPPIIEVTPANLDFPNVPIKLLSTPLQVQIRNTGGANLLPGTKTFSPDDGRFTISGDSCGGIIIPGASCTFNVIFQSATPGPFATTLAIASNDPATPLQTVAVTATALPPIIEVTPATLDFPNASINLPSTPQQVQIKNVGGADLLPGARTFSPNDGLFTVTADTCGGSLIPGASCTFTIVFQTATPGPAAATLSIASDDPASPLKTVALTGTALAPLAISFTGSGSGTVLARAGQTVSSCTANCSREFTLDTLVTLVPRTDLGATFTGWSGCDSVIGTACMVTMGSARTASAAFGTATPGATVGIATGFSHTLALKGNGQIWAWGYNVNGQLGNGAVGSISTIPVQTAALPGVTAVAAGYFHSLALESNGTVWSWGYNSSGQLGNGSTNPSATPVAVSGLTGIIAIAGGNDHTLALKDDGTVWAWGGNALGKLGNGNTTPSSSPVPVTGLTDIIAIAAGGTHSVALKNDGTVWTWGANSAGQLGNGGTGASSSPVPVSGLTGVTAIVAGSAHTVALKSNGTVWTWGQNSDGQLGNSSNTSSSSPVAVTGLTGVTAIAAGSVHTLALKNDGTVWAWGDNYSGQLGRGMLIESIEAVDVPTLSGITALASLGTHSVVLKNDGTIWAWGWNGSGQIGNGTSSGYVPVITPEMQQPFYVKLQASGQYDSYFVTLAAAASHGATAPLIKTQQQVYSESLNISQCGSTVTLGGAYDPTYASLLGPTIIQGSVTVSCGTLIVEALQVQ